VLAPFLINRHFFASSTNQPVEDDDDEWFGCDGLREYHPQRVQLSYDHIQKKAQENTARLRLLRYLLTKVGLDCGDTDGIHGDEHILDNTRSGTHHSQSKSSSGSINSNYYRTGKSPIVQYCLQHQVLPSVVKCLVESSIGSSYFHPIDIVQLLLLVPFVDRDEKRQTIEADELDIEPTLWRRQLEEERSGCCRSEDIRAGDYHYVFDTLGLRDNENSSFMTTMTKLDEIAPAPVDSPRTPMLSISAKLFLQANNVLRDFDLVKYLVETVHLNPNLGWGRYQKTRSIVGNQVYIEPIRYFIEHAGTKIGEDLITQYTENTTRLHNVKYLGLLRMFAES
jgi:hypothetical protein